jgi:hypothetical protein
MTSCFKKKKINVFLTSKIVINYFGGLVFIEYIFSSHVKTTPVPIPIFLTGFIDYWSATTLHCYTYFNKDVIRAIYATGIYSINMRPPK